MACDMDKAVTSNSDACHYSIADPNKKAMHATKKVAMSVEHT